MADHPLRPATHRRLGRPLPYQLANGTQAHRQAVACKQRPPFSAGPEGPVVLSGISSSFPKLSRTRRQITHALLTRAPLECSRRSLSARLACLRHAASVRSEPGSNSSCKPGPGATQNGVAIRTAPSCSELRDRGTEMPREPQNDWENTDPSGPSSLPIRLLDRALFSFQRPSEAPADL